MKFKLDYNLEIQIKLFIVHNQYKSQKEIMIQYKIFLKIKLIK